MDVSPRRRELPNAKALERLRAAVAARTAAEVELKAAVIAAKAAGGSVRVIAEEAGISSRTVLTWTKSE